MFRAIKFFAIVAAAMAFANGQSEGVMRYIIASLLAYEAVDVLADTFKHRLQTWHWFASFAILFVVGAIVIMCSFAILGGIYGGSAGPTMPTNYYPYR